MYIISFIGEAESGLERLHQCAEKDLQSFLTVRSDNTEPAPSIAEFGDFRVKLAGLTRYFTVMVFPISFWVWPYSPTACFKLVTLVSISTSF